MASTLTSKPIHASIQWLLDKTIVVPITIENSIVVIKYGLINKDRNLTYLFGVWAQELYIS